VKSQWECFLENLGVWQGSFTSLSAEGQILGDQPTRVTIQTLGDRTSVRLTVEYLTTPERNLNLEFSTLNRAILFFESGAFSQGSMQATRFGEFGAEQGLRCQERRLRSVLRWHNGDFQSLVLIREGLPNTAQPERPTLQLSDLEGVWQGQAETRYPDGRSPEVQSTQLSVTRQAETVQYRLQWGEQERSATARLEDDSRLEFEQSRLLLLPDGASLRFPLILPQRQPFQLEMGWLLAVGERQRLIRSYDASGAWTSVTLVTEQRVA
jgi:hypothetical protein